MNDLKKQLEIVKEGVNTLQKELEWSGLEDSYPTISNIIRSIIDLEKLIEE